MTEPNRLPLRVLVKGASTVVYTSWMSGPRSDLAWPRVVEEQLLRRRLPGRGPLHRDARRAHPPGHPHLAGGGAGVVARRHLPQLRADGVRPPVLAAVVRAPRQQRQGTAHPGPDVLPQAHPAPRLDDAGLPAALPSTPACRRTCCRTSAAACAADLQRYIERVRTVASPLVLIPDIIPPGQAVPEVVPRRGGTLRGHDRDAARARGRPRRARHPDVRVAGRDQPAARPRERTRIPTAVTSPRRCTGRWARPWPT